MNTEIINLYKRIGTRLVASVKRNFQAGGRPVKWKPSQRANKKIKGKSGKTLIDTGRLKDSVTFQIKDNTIEVGSNVEYAPIHQFGGKSTMSQTVKEHTRKINQAFGRQIPQRTVTVKRHKRNITVDMPARPFLMIQDEDREYMLDLVKEFTERFITDNLKG